MINYKLLDYLKQLTSVEMDEFEDFVNSPFFNKSRQAVKLYAILLRHHPDFKRSMIRKERVFKQIYGDEPYNDDLLRKNASILTSLVKEFIKIKAFQTEEGIDQELFLLYGLRKRKNKEEYLNTKKKRDEKLSGLTYNDSQLYLKGHLNELEDLYFYMNNDMQEKAGKAITEQAEYLICYLLNNFTNCLYIMDSNRNAFNIEYGSNLIKEFINCFDIDSFVEKASELNSKNYPAFLLELNRAMMVLNPADTSYYYKCKSFIEEHPDFFDKRLKLALFFKLIFYSAGKMSEGHIEFAKELLMLYRTVLDEQLGLTDSSDGYFPAAAFRNIVVSAAASNEIPWLEEFIQKYADTLNPEWKDELVNYSNVILHFHKGSYEKALGFILDITYKNTFIKHDVLRYKLFVFYELGYTEEIESVINSFKYSVKTVADLSSQRQKVLNELIKYVRELVRFRTGIDTDPLMLERYISKLHKWKSFYRTWFIEKAEDILKNKKPA
jgi:hypothetical protein